MARRKRKALVYVLPGVERRDLGADVASRAVIDAAIRDGVDPIIIVGRDRSGGRFVSSSVGDADRVVGMLTRAAAWLASHEVELDP